MLKDNKETLDGFAMVLFCNFALGFNVMIPERIYQIFKKKKIKKKYFECCMESVYVNYCQNTIKDVLI